MNEKTLTFELVGGDELEIHGDIEGLRSLVGVLQRLIRDGGHEHLMTAAWGGADLTEEPQNQNSLLLNKVTVRRW